MTAFTTASLRWLTRHGRWSYFSRGGIAGEGALMWRHLVTRGAYITAVRPRDVGIEERDME